ncbi:MAG: HAD hydrolase family protein [Selenomonadaceae bacterium]
MKFVQTAVSRAQKIRLVIFDVDGVLTDGNVYIGVDGELYKPFNCHDGLGISLLRRFGIKRAIITGRTSKMLDFRAKELRFDDVQQGHFDKREALRMIQEKFGMQLDEIAYVGDDLVDLPIMVQVGFAASVGNAVPEVKEHAHLIADAPGGKGAVREIAEFILKAQGHWDEVIEEFISPGPIKNLNQ